MKRIALSLLATVLGAALAATSYAQTRHDEKPHGSAKPVARTSESGPMTGMRHDERPHGTRKLAPKKNRQEKSAAGAQAGKSGK